MAGITTKSFNSPDETRSPDKTKSEIVNLGNVNAARMTLQPGWRWSECIKPLVGTDSCQARHLGTVVSGSLTVKHDDGSEVTLKPGDAYLIEPGHDAWVEGNDPLVGYEFESTTAESFAR
jgi:D-lyxose ketol-isomerase